MLFILFYIYIIIINIIFYTYFSAAYTQNLTCHTVSEAETQTQKHIKSAKHTLIISFLTQFSIS